MKEIAAPNYLMATCLLFNICTILDEHFAIIIQPSTKEEGSFDQQWNILNRKKY